ncbi:HTH-type transcriptional regulator CysL [Pelotomaculum sp. FP]|uniref:selenium metabolism-associated LysR family transcriptional regulator n=1 Tax=Pelotomaculum sp. FP TaxID=261474 RepID=UPI00106465EC|nr:selenium metabolism-associated LysR family transcriptional regulator [Pelotomaculum sp. FP]TEB15686.1 HTH-type transcriptional regulator CysL [Pelotomaculum sp. FP]
MNFKQIEAFLWVAEMQSFTKAARQLYMSQPAVSFQIKALEEDLEADLFQRGDKKVILTEAGRLLYPEAKKMLRHYHKIKAGLDDLRGLKTGTLVVGASTIPGEYVLPLLIGGFKEAYPGIRVTLKVAGSGLVTRWVREREIDLGITGVPVEGDGIECSPWMQDEMVLIVNPSHPWVKSGAIDISELKTSVMIFREQGSGTRRTLEKKLETKGLSLEDIPHGMELGSTRAVITAVEAGLGVSIVSRCAVKDALELKRISEVKVQGLDLNRSLYLIKQNQSIGGFAVEAFCNFINNGEICKRFLIK